MRIGKSRMVSRVRLAGLVLVLQVVIAGVGCGDRAGTEAGGVAVSDADGASGGGAAGSDAGEPAETTAEAPAEVMATLRPERVWAVRAAEGHDAALELSGLAWHEGRWLTVSDDPAYADIYELKEAGDGINGTNETMTAQPYLSFGEMEGMGGWDLEGIAVCGEKFLVAEEGTYSVVEVAGEGRTVVRPVKLERVFEEMGEVSRTEGAGLEGLACDAEGGVVYVAQEWEPRMIFVLDARTMEARDYFDVPPGRTQFAMEEGRISFPDFADLYFEGGYLYALERISRQVVKIDPERKRVVARVRLDFRETDYYDHNGFYGLAEGLCMAGGVIRVALDAGGMQVKGRPGARSGMVLEFARPEGF